MLLREDGLRFSTGRCRFLDQDGRHDEPTAKIFVKVEPGSLNNVILAQVDTGAAWSILDAEIADELALLDGDGAPQWLSTRMGRLEGRLERTRIAIVGDEGESLSVDATVWVSPEWRSGTFLGYAGLLERIRFAVDPSENAFHFGQA